MISSVVCIGGSLCLKYRKAFIDIELETNSSKHLKNASLVLQSVHRLVETKVPELLDESDESEPAMSGDGAAKYAPKGEKNPHVAERRSLVLKDLNESDYEWLKTMCIDNPLNPYRNLYQKKLDKIKVGNIVTSKDMETIFRSARKISYTGAIISLIIFFIVVPAVALSQTVLGASELAVWISVCQHWCLIGTVLVVVVPPVQECLQIWRQYSLNKKGQTIN